MSSVLTSTLNVKYQENIGEIDEEGLINSLDRDGLTDERAILELAGNVPDAYMFMEHDNMELTFSVNKEGIFLKDKAIGFTPPRARAAFALYKALHNLDRSVGVSNYGLKAALKKLSRNGISTIYTHAKNDLYLKIVVDWEVIIKKKLYTDNVKMTEMTEEEKLYFIKEMDGNNTGTIIHIPYSEIVHEEIKSHFTEERIKKSPMDRIDYAFGKIDNFIIMLHDEIDNVNLKLTLYNPFGLERSSFLFGGDGREEKNIRLYLKNNSNDDYLFAQESDDGSFQYFKTTAKSTTTKIKEGRLPKGYTHVEDFTQQLTCIKPENDYYDVENPKKPDTVRLSCVSKYEKDFYGITNQHVEHRNNMMPLVRNKARIGLIPIGTKAQTSGGDSQKEKFTKLHIQNELLYSPLSSQQNPSDKFMGVQKNKHAFHPDEKQLKGLIRLCDYNRNEFANRLWNLMEAAAVVEDEAADIEDEVVVDDEAAVEDEAADVDDEAADVDDEVTLQDEAAVVEDEAAVDDEVTLQDEVESTVEKKTQIVEDVVSIVKETNIYENKPPRMVSNYEQARPMTEKEGLLFMKTVLENISILELDDMIHAADDKDTFNGLGRATLIFKDILNM